MAAGRVAVLSAELILQHRELLYCVVRNGHDRTGDILAIVIDAFHVEAVVARTLSAHRGSRANAETAAAGHACAEQREVEDSSSNGCGRQVHGHATGIVVGHLCGSSVEQGGRIGDFEGRGDSTDFERHVDGCNLVEIDDKFF